MTSDAKVGLLLGLVFIVIIAFLINGLPNLLTDSDGDRITTITSANASMVLDEQADQAVKALTDMGIDDNLQPRQVDVADDPRFSETPPVVDGQTARQQRIDQRTRQSNQPGTVKPKQYVIQSGDNLAKIAKKLYGPDEGNRHVTIQKLFEANRKTLKSPDDIIVGQKLIVPSLAIEPTPIPTTIQEAEESGMLQRVTTAFRNVVNRPEPKTYVVKDGDTLWDIASNYLGDGSRYEEIVKLNRSAVNSDDTVNAGVQLKLPIP